MADKQQEPDNVVVLDPDSPEMGIEVVEESSSSGDEAGNSKQENIIREEEPECGGDVLTEESAIPSSKPSTTTDRSLSLNLPLSKIRLIMKTDPDVAICSADSAFLITRCTELFMKHLAEEAYKSTKAANRKTVQKKDVDDAIKGVDQFFFLDGAL